MRATLIVPTLNEAGSIGHVLTVFRTASEAANRTRFANAPVEWQMLVVDGASSDGTGNRAEAAGATVVTEPRPGYGRAYRTGFAKSTGELIATADGDGTYPVAEIPRFVEYLLDHDLDFLSGDRLSTLNPKAMTMEHRIGNRALNWFLRVAYHRVLSPLPGGTLQDSQSGFWVFRRRVLERVQLTQAGMALSEEIKLEAIFRGFRFEEVPIPYAERWGAPKLSSWRDGLRNLSFLLEKRLEIAREIQRASARPHQETLVRPDR